MLILMYNFYLELYFSEMKQKTINNSFINGTVIDDTKTENMK